MSPTRTYSVYILANVARTLYIGVTNDLYRRMYEHKTGKHPGFATRYRITELVYTESYTYVNDAISREKQLKGWLRSKKVALVETVNPEWADLSADWFTQEDLLAVNPDGDPNN